MCGGHSADISLKFSMNLAASASYFLKYSSRLGQVLAGSSISEGTPSQDFGTSNPNTGSLCYSTSRSEPLRAAFSNRRVYWMLMRFPTPKGPPVQPVFTSQQCAP